MKTPTHKLVEQPDGLWAIEPAVPILRPHNFWGEPFEAPRVRSTFAETLKEQPVGKIHIGHNLPQRAETVKVGAQKNYSIKGDEVFAEVYDLEPQTALDWAMGRLSGRSVEMPPSARDGTGGEWIASTALLGGDTPFIAEYEGDVVFDLSGDVLDRLKAGATKRPLASVRSVAKPLNLRLKSKRNAMPDDMPPADDAGAPPAAPEIMTPEEMTKAIKGLQAAIAKLAAPPAAPVAPPAEPPAMLSVAAKATQDRIEALERSNRSLMQERAESSIRSIIADRRKEGATIDAPDEADLITDAMARPEKDRAAYVTRRVALYSVSATIDDITADGGGAPVSDEAEVLSKLEKEVKDPVTRKSLRSLVSACAADIRLGYVPKGQTLESRVRANLNNKFATSK